MGFNLPHLVNRYLHVLTPWVHSNRFDAPNTLLDEYSHALTKIDEAIAKGDEKAKAYKSKLLGGNLILSAPADYWDIAMFTSLHYTATEWRAMSLKDRAKIIAQAQLSGMAQILQQHRDNMKEAMAKYEKANGKH